LAVSRNPTFRVPIAALVAALSLLLAVDALATDPGAGKTYSAFTAKTPAAAVARIAAISGTLTKPGYTVMALAANGKLTSVRAGPGLFTLRPPAATVTLQLRAPNGVYGGPIVVAVKQRGKRTVMGVRAGARLGKIDVYARRGYAKVARTPASRWVDTTRWAQAKNGVPIGAGRFGLVRSTPPRHPPVGDLDADGIPDVLDIDVNGNLVLNNVDRSKLVRGSQAAVDVGPIAVKAFLGLDAYETANADSPALAANIPTAGSSGSRWLDIAIMAGDFVELDCGGLTYCSRGGTGTVNLASGQSLPFPACCDPDGNGLGNLTPTPPGGSPLVLRPNTAQVGTGDVLIERASTNGVQSQVAIAIQYVFATVPALVSYDDRQGDSVTVPYPIQAPGADGSPGGPGSTGNGFPVKAGPNGDVVLRLTFWRPQRAPIAPESAPWIDIGHLNYGARLSDTGLQCPRSTFSDPSPILAPAPTSYDWTGGVFTDQAGDQPANPANTLSYTLDLTKCLAAHGRSFNPGENYDFSFGAMACGSSNCTIGSSNGPDEANQSVSFTRQ
jgi:hypothetical protein